MFDDKKINNTFGKNLRELRIQKGLTQEQLSEKINMQPQSIGQLEIGRTFISSKKLANLCNFFEVDPTIFFSRSIKTITEKDLDYIREIKHLLPLFNSSKLKEIYEILLVIKNNN